MKKRFKEVDLENFKGTLKVKDTKTLTESKETASLIEKMVKHIFIEKKSVTVAKVEAEDYLFYELEKIDDNFILARHLLISTDDDPEDDLWDVARTELSKEEIALLDHSNYDNGLLELALELDKEQWRFGI